MILCVTLLSFMVALQAAPLQAQCLNGHGVFEKLFAEREVSAHYCVGGICIEHVAMPFQIVFRIVKTCCF